MNQSRVRNSYLKIKSKSTIDYEITKASTHYNAVMDQIESAIYLMKIFMEKYWATFWKMTKIVSKYQIKRV